MGCISKVLRTYKFKCVHSLKYLRVLTKVFTSHSLKYLRVLTETSTSYSFYCCCYRRAPTGRYSCIAQGASPGLIIETHLLSPKGAALPRRKANARAVSAAPTELILFLSVCTQGFISGFALISPWAFQECRAYGTHNAP